MAEQDPIRVILRLHAHGDMVDKAADLLAGVAGASRTNPECLEFRVFRDADDRARFTLFEYWSSFEANREHATRADMAEFEATRDTVFATTELTVVTELAG